MDLFRVGQMKQVGIGGIKCPCCNGNARNHTRFNKIARQFVKAETKKIFQEEYPINLT